MSLEALANGRVLLDEGLVEGRVVLVDGERIAAVTDARDPRLRAARTRDLDGALLLPGFVDCQVNGGGGALFNDAPSVATIEQIGRAHRRFGTTAFLPTLISDDMSVIRRAIDAVREAIARRVPGVVGIHIEGPFISAARKGAHDGAKVRDLDARGVALLASLGVGRTLVTLAPEVAEPQTIRALADSGVVISAGHTNATFEQTLAAFASGVSGVTHLFNAMSPMTNREPGTVGAALHDPDCWCGLIVDGRHVHPAVLRLALRAKSPERFMLVTDAMPSVGSERDHFLLQGRRIVVKDGVCMDEHGTLAGSAIDMASAVRNAIDLLGLPLELAVRMASAHPARFLRMEGEIGRIAQGQRANFVVADDRMRVRETWIDGHAA
jgi:N-acetylglucosamine-6-phosphate deacetylase